MRERGEQSHALPVGFSAESYSPFDTEPAPNTPQKTQIHKARNAARLIIYLHLRERRTKRKLSIKSAKSPEATGRK